MHLWLPLITIFRQFKGLTPSACWNKIYNRTRKVHSSTDSPNVLGDERNGSDMFGLSNPEVIKLVQVSSFCILIDFV